MDGISRRQIVRGAAAAAATAALGAPSVHAQKDLQILRFIAEADQAGFMPDYTGKDISTEYDEGA